MPPSRYVRRPCCHSWIRARGSHPMRSSTSIAETDLSSARAASAAVTMRASSRFRLSCTASNFSKCRVHIRGIELVRIECTTDPFQELIVFGSLRIARAPHEVRVLPDSTHVLRRTPRDDPARHTDTSRPASARGVFRQARRAPSRRQNRIRTASGRRQPHNIAIVTSRSSSTSGPESASSAPYWTSSTTNWCRWVSNQPIVTWRMSCNSWSVVSDCTCKRRQIGGPAFSQRHLELVNGEGTCTTSGPGWSPPRRKPCR